MSKMVLREAQPKDMPALYELHRQQLERDKTRYPLPELFDEDGRQADNIPMALVLEGPDGPMGAVIFEDKGLEMMLVGCSPRLTVALKQSQTPILYTLRNLGYRWIRVLVTRSVLPRLRKVMKDKDLGFRRDDTCFASFFKEI